jgi:hypothetical protein
MLFCLLGVSAGENGSATWPLVAVAAFSSTVMLGSLRTISSLVPAVISPKLEG